MKTAVINIRTDAGTKAKAQKKAKALGLDLSFIINSYLKNFTADSQKKYQGNPYGIFSGSEITENEINEVTHSLDREVDKLLEEI